MSPMQLKLAEYIFKKAGIKIFKWQEVAQINTAFDNEVDHAVFIDHGGSDCDAGPYCTRVRR